jgi:hypothetical protein
MGADILIPRQVLQRICESTYFCVQYADNGAIRKVALYDEMYLACAGVCWKGPDIQWAILYEMLTVPHHAPHVQASKGDMYAGHVMCNKLRMAFGRRLTAHPTDSPKTQDQDIANA